MDGRGISLAALFGSLVDTCVEVEEIRSLCDRRTRGWGRCVSDGTFMGRGDNCQFVVKSLARQGGGPDEGYNVTHALKGRGVVLTDTGALSV